jgi:tetratricopeptide (TPR) repeat protein
VLRWLGAGFHFGVLFPLAAAGACAARGNGRRQWLLHLIFGVYGFSLVLFYLFSRYRFPLVPILTLWAAVGILLLVEALHSRRWPALLGWSAVLLAAAALSNWRITPVAPMVADTYYNLACGLEEDGREGQAEEAYRQALEHNPAHLMALNNLGYLHQRRGDLLRALEWYGKALQIDPGLEKLQVNLGMTYGALGRTADAIRHYRRAIGINPRLNPAVYFNLACMHARRGENGEALLWLRRAASHGFTRRAALLEDPDLASLRQEAEFRAILEALPAR